MAPTKKQREHTRRVRRGNRHEQRQQHVDESEWKNCIKRPEGPCHWLWKL
jgi:hypothetical protein